MRRVAKLVAKMEEEIDRQVKKLDNCDSVWLPVNSGSEEDDGEGSSRYAGGEEWVAGYCLGLPYGEAQLEK